MKKDEKKFEVGPPDTGHRTPDTGHRTPDTGPPDTGPPDTGPPDTKSDMAGGGRGD